MARAANIVQAYLLAAAEVVLSPKAGGGGGAGDGDGGAGKTIGRKVIHVLVSALTR